MGTSTPYSVILPKDTYRDPNGNSSGNFDCTDNTRVAIHQDIINAINRYK
jgi:hypothetical protein